MKKNMEIFIFQALQNAPKYTMHIRISANKSNILKAFWLLLLVHDRPLDGVAVELGNLFIAPPMNPDPTQPPAFNVLNPLTYVP